MVADPCRRRAAGMARSAAVAFLAADQRRFPSVWHWQTAANGVRPAFDGLHWTVRCVIECAAPGVVSGGCQMEIRGEGCPSASRGPRSRWLGGLGRLAVTVGIAEF